MSLIERDQQVRHLHRTIDREAREVNKYLGSQAHSDWVKVSAIWGARAAFALYPELREDDSTMKGRGK